jgi:flavin reductase (DIM6/NTAB) family NADH-FMN oxidoreductase RutF
VLQDCLAFVECRIAEVHSGGDHTIFLGEVVDLGIVKDVKPLLFFRGMYRFLT